tara:strand:+ start:2559 stop:3863 length:1305 start_codon:yes stop_codon:yes gene_type:complete
MGGGLLQLVAYGAQDVYLTGNPQITFFKVVYRRHTNFSLESIQQSINGNFDWGNRVSCQISRNGDLVHKMYVEVELEKLYDGNTITNILTENLDRYVNFIGHRLLKSVEVEIGGQKIDKQYSHWMYIWNELSLPIGKMDGYQEMIGADSDMTSFKDNKIYIPLEFWFCRNIGLALPLIALQYHEVKINIEIESFDNCTYNGTAYVKNSTGTVNRKSIKNATIWCDYVFLDTDERKRFAQLSHEYLIEQVQMNENTVSGTNEQSISLVMNHPVKEIIWTINDTEKATLENQWYNYTDSEIFADSNNEAIERFGDDSNQKLQNTLFGIDPDGNNSITSANLQLNGNDRFAKRNGDYFSLVQPYQHHTNIPSNAGINVYSFALKPEEHQPSGTLNMSRIDTARLVVKPKRGGTIRVWGVNYNVLRILSGMGGLAYSN